MLKIEVLGPGCPKCQLLEQNVRTAVEEMELDAEVTKVSDIKEIASRGVLMTPGVVIDGAVRSQGKVPTRKDVESWLADARD